MTTVDEREPVLVHGFPLTAGEGVLHRLPRVVCWLVVALVPMVNLTEKWYCS